MLPTEQLFAQVGLDISNYELELKKVNKPDFQKKIEAGYSIIIQEIRIQNGPDPFVGHAVLIFECFMKNQELIYQIKDSGSGEVDEIPDSRMTFAQVDKFCQKHGRYPREINCNTPVLLNFGYTLELLQKKKRIL